MAANISDAPFGLDSVVGHLSHRVRMIAPDQTRRELLRTPMPRTRLNRSKKCRGSYARVPLDQGVDLHRIALLTRSLMPTSSAPMLTASRRFDGRRCTR